MVGTPPSIHRLPPAVHSLAAAQEAIELAEEYGLALDPSQQTTLLTGLGERRDGSWAAGEVGDSKGRQAGKGDTINARELAGIHLFDENLIIHTAHEFPTANEAFLRLVAVHENFDDLRRTVRNIRYANGEQGIEYLSGQRIKYKARTGGSGRGFAEADLVVYDEAQSLLPEHLAASLPTLLANPNFQAWYAGSGGFIWSVVWWRIRRRAIAGDGSRLAFTEEGAQRARMVKGKLELTHPDPAAFLDEEVLLTHAGYRAGRSTRDGMETMYRALGAELYGREVLNIWDPEPDEGGETVVNMDVWDGLAQVSAIDDHRRWALVVSPDRRWAALGIAGLRSDGRYHVEWMDHRAGTGWIVDRCVEAYKARGIPLRVHAQAAEAAHIDRLREAGVAVEEVSTADVGRATGLFIDAVNNGMLIHAGQPSLRKALEHAELRVSAEGVSLWDQRGQTEITTLKAVTVALGGIPEPQDFPTESTYDEEQGMVTVG